MLFPSLFPRSRALITAHRCLDLGNGRTGGVGGLLAILESPEFYDSGLGCLWGSSIRGDQFFEYLQLDMLDEPGPWVVEVAVGGERLGSDDWSHLVVKEIRRPTDEELLNGMYGLGGWELV